MGMISIMALSAIVVPFVVAFLIIVCPRPYAKWLCIIAGAISSALCVGVWIELANNGGEAVTTTLASLGDAAIITFIFDKMSVMLATAFVVIGLLIAIYSTAYMSDKNREHPDAPRRRFYAFFTIFIGAMAGLVYSNTLVSQLIFFEITGACSWALIGYYGTPTAQKSAMKALILTHIAALGLYVAAAFLYLQTGTSEVSAIAQLNDYFKTIVLVCIIIAAWGKSAQLPFYMWLPSAMEAPTPVSAYLHGASMVKVGVAVLARGLVSAGAIPEAVGWVIVVGAICTMIFSFFMYLPQKDMKKLLAFSTISQLSYIFLGFAFFCFGSDQAFTGSVQHMFNHAFTKTLFFLIAGTFSFCVGTRMLPKLKGVLKKYPLLAVGFGCAALGIAGCPPFNGFFSKFEIFSGAFAAAQDNTLLMAIVIVGLIETVGCFAWFLKQISNVLFGEQTEEIKAGQPVPVQISAVLVILIVMTVASSFIAASWLG